MVNGIPVADEDEEGTLETIGAGRLLETITRPAVLSLYSLVAEVGRRSDDYVPVTTDDKRLSARYEPTRTQPSAQALTTSET